MAKVLVIDDDPGICEAVQLVLGREGHEVASAEDLESGRRSVSEFGPDLIILDVMMERPDDGFILAQELRGSGFAKPILMLTSVGHVTGLTFGADQEMVPVDEFYEKPISPAKLVETVGRLLGKGEGGSDASK